MCVKGEPTAGVLPSSGSTVSVTPSCLAFLAAQNVGTTSAAKTVTFKNTGSTALSLSPPAVSGDFVLSGTTCGATLAARSQCTASVKFRPTQPGVRTGTLTFTDSDASSPQLVSLQGMGIGAKLSSLSLAFTAQAVGTTSAARTLTLKNLMPSPMTINSAGITGTNSADFSIRSSGTCPQPSGTLAGLASCNLQHRLHTILEYRGRPCHFRGQRFQRDADGNAEGCGHDREGLAHEREFR